MEFEFKNYLKGKGFTRDPFNERVYSNISLDIKVKFIHPTEDSFANVAISNPGKIMPKTTHEYPVSFTEADGIVVPYLEMDKTLLENMNEFVVHGYLTTKIPKEYKTIAYIEVKDKKAVTTIAAFDFMGKAMELLNQIPEQTNVGVKFKIHGPFIRSRYVPRLTVLDIWKL